MFQEYELYRVLEEFLKDSTLEKEKSFYSQLKKIKLYVPIEKKNKRFLVCALTSDTGKEFYAAFTSLNQYEKWPFGRKENKVLEFDYLKYLILEDQREIDGIDINPFGVAILLEKENIERMDFVTMGMSSNKTKGLNNKIHLLEPENVPKGLKMGLYIFLHQRKNVKEVILYQAKRNEEDFPHWLFVIKFHGNKIELFQEIANLIKFYMEVGEVFELVSYADNIEEINHIDPYILYQRD